MNKTRGNVYVAKYNYKTKVICHKPGATTLLMHVKNDTFGASLSPYVLRNEKGHLLENTWQFSKVYPKVKAITTKIHQYSNKIIWEHPEEIHIDSEGNLTKEFWAWRKKGRNNEYAVRYPNGFYGRTECQFSICKNELGEYECLDYIQARKGIYYAEYEKLCKTNNEFIEIKERLNNGESFLIIEVDGPDPLLDFPPYNRISVEKPWLRISQNVINLLVNDTRKPFGHGFCIASLLLDLKI
jgi:hypothetical protein